MSHVSQVYDFSNPDAAYANQIRQQSAEVAGR